MTVEMTISATIAQIVEKAMTRKASERGPTVSVSRRFGLTPVGPRHASGSRMR